MRKIKVVMIILITAFLLSACNNGGDILLIDDGSLNADNQLKKILSSIDESDCEVLENMFSKAALSEVSNFCEQAENLFQMVDGTVISWERTGFTSSTSMEDGEESTQSIAWYNVTTDKMEYVFFTIECTKDAKQPNNIGLTTLAVVKKADEELKLTYWQDMQIPGIYMP